MAKATGEQSISSYVVAFLSVEGSVGRAASMPSIVQKFSGVFTPKQIWTATIRMEDAGLIHRFLIDGQPYFTTTSCAGKVFVPLPFKLSPGIAELYAAIGIRPPPLIPVRFLLTPLWQVRLGFSPRSGLTSPPTHPIA